MRYGFSLRSRFAALATTVAVTSMFMVSSCSKSNPVQVDNTNSWTFTATVLDGYTGKSLVGAKVSYVTMDNKDSVVLTSSQGRVNIDGLAPGAQSFKISVDSAYTSVVINAEGVRDSSKSGSVYNNVTQITKLFPLKGSISGRVLAQRNKLATKDAAAAVLVSVSYANADLDNAYPKAFQVATDSTGAFSLAGLPVASGCKVTVANITIKGVDFAPGVLASPTLVPALSVPLGTILVTPINASAFKQMTAAPLVIAPNQTISVTYSDLLDSVSYATLEGVSGSQSILVNTSVNGNKISVSPSISLVDGDSYWLTIYAIGKAGGDSTSKTTLIVKGGGLVDVASSNVLDNNKKAIDGLALTDSMVFTFRENLTSGSATVTKAGTPVLVDVSTSGKTLTIKPKGNWESTTYTVKISATLNGETSSSSSFTFNIATVGGLDFIASNVYNPKTLSAINGIGIADPISITANKDLADAQITLSEASGSPVPVSVITKNAGIMVTPLNSLKPATSYTITVSAMTDVGETKSFTTTFTTASSDFYPIVDNIRYDNDPVKPMLNFSPNGIIFIKMSASIQSASAKLLVGNANGPTVTVSTSSDTVFISPDVNLTEGTAYNLKVSVSSKTGTVFNANSGNYVTGFYVKNTFTPITSNVRYNSDATQPVLDFAPNGTIVIVMSDIVQTATALLTNSGTTVPADVKISGDTIRVIPQDVLPLSGVYSVTFDAKNANGLTFSGSPLVTGFKVQNKVRVLASNVLSADGLGLSDIPVTSTLWYLLSATPDPTTLDVMVDTSATPSSATAINKTVTVSGDTLKIVPSANLLSGTKYSVVISGKTTQNNIISLSLNTAAKQFTTRNAAYVVATNMLDANGNSLTNLLPSTELWVKFSRPLAAATLQQLGGGLGTTATYVYGVNSNNVTVRIANDTLFAKFIPNALPAYGAKISVKSVSIVFADNTKLGVGGVDIESYIMSKATPYVIATNGIKNNAVVDTFGVMGEAWIVSSLSFRSVDAVKNGPDGLSNVGASNLVVSSVRTSGDTIFYKPAATLGYSTDYQVAFNVTLADSSKYTGTDLKLRWKTQKALALVSANDMVNSQLYRTYTVTGDSLVLSFNKPIDITKTYSIGGWVSKLNYSWSADKMTLTVKPVDTLGAESYEAIPDNSLAGTAKYAAITVSVTASDGEAWAAQATTVAGGKFTPTRPDLRVHTENGIEVLNTNLKVSAINKSLAYINSDNTKLSAIGAGLIAQNDSIKTTDSLKVYFNRALDSAYIVNNLNAAVQLKIGAVVLNSTVLFANARKTLIVVPTVALTPNTTTYSLVLLNDFANGFSQADANAKAAYTLGFSTRPAVSALPVTASVVTLAADTATTTNVWNKRIAYSGSIVANPYAFGLDAADVAAQNTIKLSWYNVAFRSTTDTVSHYQLSVKGSDGNWYDLVTLVPAGHFNWTSPLTDSIKTYTLNLSGVNNDVNGQNVSAILQVSPKTNFNNAASIFNYGTVVAVKIRPVVSTNGTWEPTDLSGTWSTPITFQDNVAPCDTDFVAKPGVLGNLGIVNNGGVAVVAAVPGDGMQRSGIPASGDYVFTVTFPEDMDTSATSTNALVVTSYYGGVVPASLIAKNAAKSYWTSGRVYHLTMNIPGSIDWTGAGTALPYYAVSVAGMKDASGVSIQQWGSVGDAANAKLIGAVAGATQGTVNMLNLTAY